MTRRSAIDLAIDSLSKPGIASLLAAGPLPDGLKGILRIAAEGEWRDRTTDDAYRRHSPETVRSACVAFLSTVLFQAQSDPYRVLGLPKGAAEAEVTEHKRLLLKWLHPDRNSSPREQAFLQQVLEAAAAIEGKSSPSRSSVGQRDAAPPRRATAIQPSKPARAPADGEARKRAARLLRSFGETVKHATYALLAVVAALVAWRYFMSEPIGVSLERYSEAALGLVKW